MRVEIAVIIAGLIVAGGFGFKKLTGTIGSEASRVKTLEGWDHSSKKSSADDDDIEIGRKHGQDPTKNRKPADSGDATQTTRSPDGDPNFLAAWKDPYLRPDRGKPVLLPTADGQPPPPLDDQKRAERERIDALDRYHQNWIRERYGDRKPVMDMLDETGARDAKLLVFGETRTPDAGPMYFAKLLGELKAKYPDLDTVFVEAEQRLQPDMNQVMRTGDASKFKTGARANAGNDPRVLEAAAHLKLKIVCVDANDKGIDTRDPKRDKLMGEMIGRAVKFKQTKRAVFIVGSYHLREKAIPAYLKGVPIRVYRVRNHYWSMARGGEFANPPIDAETPPDHSTMRLEVDKGEWAFKTRTDAQPPYLEVGERWDVYDGYIHIPEVK